MVARFPPGTLQFEIGIQTFDPEVQARISRKQKNELAEANLRWLRAQANAHLHVDLIAGLPGESLQGFAAGFDRLVALQPHEIQFGILKRLRGAPIARHSQAFDLRFSADPPYSILSNRDLDFSTLQRMNRFARYWDIVANSGRYPRTLPWLLANSPFARFMAFADWLYATTGQTHALAHERLVHLLRDYLGDLHSAEIADIERDLIEDYHASGGRSRLRFETEERSLPRPQTRGAKAALPKRQARHLRAEIGQ